MPNPKIVARHKIVAFYGVPGTNSTTYYRMKKFTQFSHSKNPIEYSRQYVDEPFQQTDVVGFAPSYAYAFDKHTDLPVQEDIVSITNGEMLGDDAVRDIIIVDTTAATGTTTLSASGLKRSYSVIPNTEGDNINVYTYSGNLKVRGEQSEVTVSTADDWQTISISD
jgi:hypothetical protein